MLGMFFGYAIAKEKTRRKMSISNRTEGASYMMRFGQGRLTQFTYLQKMSSG
jgi:hypothetical protein